MCSTSTLQDVLVLELLYIELIISIWCPQFNFIVWKTHFFSWNLRENEKKEERLRTGGSGRTKLSHLREAKPFLILCEWLSARGADQAN